MLKWAFYFFAFAILAGFFGFTDVAGSAAWIAQLLFIVATTLVIFFVLVSSLRPPST